MNHLPPRSARQIAFVWRPRPAGGRGRRHGGWHPAPIEAMEPRVLLSGSVYDESFGSGGMARFDVFGLADAALQMVALPDGKIVVGLSALDQLSPWGSDLLVPGAIDGERGRALLARLNPDGTLDESFSDDGVTSYSFAGDTAAARTVIIDEIVSLAAQPDGKILAGVQAHVEPPFTDVDGQGTADGLGVMTVARFLPDGTLDTAFGRSGLAMANPRGGGPSTRQDVRAMALQPDGKIVAVGSLGPPAGTTSSAADWGDWGTVRFNADGSVDASFQQQVEDFPFDTRDRESTDAARAVAVAPDGKVVVAGSASWTAGNMFAIVRYNADGSRDPTFRGGARVMTGFPVVFDVGAVSRKTGDSIIQNLALQPDGKVVAVGSLGTNLAMVRYNADGTEDDSFGWHGRVATRGTYNGFYKARVADDGNLVVSGAGSWAWTEAFVATFNPAGGIAGASRGKVPTGPEPGAVPGAVGSTVFALAVQPDGKILGAGRVYSVADAGEGVPQQQTSDAIVLRFDPSDLPPVTATPIDLAAAAAPPQPPPIVVRPITSPISGAGYQVYDSAPPLPATTVIGKPIVRGGRAYSFRLSVSAGESVVRQMQVTVNGPAGFSADAQLSRLKAPRAPKPGKTAPVRPTVAKYRVAAPGGSFDASENGTYGIGIKRTVAPDVTVWQMVGSFFVKAPLRHSGPAPAASSALRRLNYSNAPAPASLVESPGVGRRDEAVSLLNARPEAVV